MRARKQDGVALIQVLLISSLIMLLALQIGFNVKTQVRLASGFVDKLNAEMQIYSAQSQVTYELLTRSHGQPAENNDAEALDWNFHGEPFRVGNVRVSLQDANGLISMISTSRSIQSHYLQHYGLPEEKAGILETSIKNWQNDQAKWQFGGVPIQNFTDYGVTPRFAPIQFKSEYSDILKVLMQDEPSLLTTIDQAVDCCMTLYASSYINILNSPPQIWAALIDSSYLQDLESARQSGTLNKHNFKAITGTQTSDDYGFLNSNDMLMTFEVQQGEIRMRALLDITLQPNNDIAPYLIKAKS
ncbi:hypothetical protein FM038_015580 [Shewanella eurypsychrophilus]|uniref:Type II secretion system protein K n=1 Tax=Shewanella eurypsychrophilus TaxID=2593656 RepID=A0ABX6V9I6_9GAMM|nr:MULTISPECIES: hypothetical protein [Shewanella]QFU23450.1 hypothetical protein FS418_17390 [Shewanella sp. YLB-09]QPG58679.1 hypothetical protein FM038_015580 [Shewanella eurypsychrophilus]